MTATDGVADAPALIRAGDGTELVARRWTPRGAPVGRLVVVHGLKDHSGRYGALGDRLNLEGFEVVAADLRGHGRSGGPRQWVRRFDDYVDDLDRVVRELAPPDGPRRFVLGHSMGGAIALRWVLERQPEIAGLALSGAALRPPPTVGTGVRAVTRFLGRVAPHAAVFRLPWEDFSRDGAAVEALSHDPLVASPNAPARTAAELLRSMAWAAPRFGRVRLPLLALHGTDDRLTDPSGSEALVAAAASADKQFRPYPGLFHDLWHEPEHEVVLGDLAGWLRDRAAATTA